MLVDALTRRFFHCCIQNSNVRLTPYWDCRCGISVNCEATNLHRPCCFTQTFVYRTLIVKSPRGFCPFSVKTPVVIAVSPKTLTERSLSLAEEYLSLPDFQASIN